MKCKHYKGVTHTKGTKPLYSIDCVIHREHKITGPTFTSKKNAKNFAHNVCLSDDTRCRNAITREIRESLKEDKPRTKEENLKTSCPDHQTLIWEEYCQQEQDPAYIKGIDY